MYAILKALIRTYYHVAEHRFAVETSKPDIFSVMSNYEPFQESSAETALQCNSDVIFTLRVEQYNLLNETERKEYAHVFTDNSEADMPRIEVYHREKNDQREAGWLLRVSIIAHLPICCEIECDSTFENGILHIANDCQDVHFCIDNALMLLYAFRTAPLMTLEMHAAVVVRPCIEIRGEERGYLFLGHSGTGKSTHARQWLAAFEDAWLLNDDNPILRVMDNGEIRVYGSPWSGKTPCYKNAYARVGGIVKLTQAPYNNIRFTSLPEAYAYMLSSASGLKIDRHMSDCLYESIKQIITHVPCCLLECLPNTEAAEVCYKGIKKQHIL